MITKEDRSERFIVMPEQIKAIPPGESHKDDLETLNNQSNSKEESQRIYISLRIPENVSDRLPFPFGQPSGEAAIPPHVTLAYIDKDSAIDSEAISAIEDACYSVASQHPVLSGQIRGVGRFPASETSDGKDVIYAGVQVPGLHEIRDDLVKTFDTMDIPYSKIHGFTPHVTLGYIPPNQDRDCRFDPIPVRFDSIYLSNGGVIKRFRFGK